MYNLRILASHLALEHRASAYSINVKSDALAYITLEYTDQWARTFRVRNGRNVEELV